MAAEVRINTRCVHCRTKYVVSGEALGQVARCARCGRSFRVAPYQPKTSPPTEDDILRWLNEGLEEYEFATRPRVVEELPTSRESAREGREAASQV
ncbi:MAG: hypothetical protein GXY55_04080 [Phycisphaerae bacterium]|nr:hypothetical protein [Phycisphaerae bacterium]